MATARPKVISIRDDNFKANRENTHGNQSGSSESPSSTQWLAATISHGQERLLLPLTLHNTTGISLYHFSERTGSSVTNTQLIVCVCH